MIHTFNPRTCEVEAGGSLSSKLAWSTQIEVQGSQDTQKKLVSKNQNQNKTKQQSGRRRGTGSQMSLENTGLKEV